MQAKAAFEPWRHWKDVEGPLGLVAAAILAANPHNTQPWSFHVTDSTIELYADTSRRVRALDPLGREMHVGLGCAIENLILAGRVRGLAPTVAWLPYGPASDLVARVDLGRQGARTTSVLHDAIGDRHTNRGPYATTAVPTAFLADLAATTDLPGVELHWITEHDAKATLGSLMVDAAAAITHDDEQSRDSFGWIRSSDAAVQRHRDGLILDAQGMSPFILAMAKLRPATSRKGGDAFWLTQTRDVHTKTAAAYGVIPPRILTTSPRG